MFLSCVESAGPVFNKCDSCQEGPSSNDCCIEAGVNSGAGCTAEGSFCCRMMNGTTENFVCTTDINDCQVGNNNLT